MPRETDARTWDRLAGGYDRSIAQLDRSYPRVRELLRRDLAGREHVLEVAAGTGQFSFELAATAKRLSATDVSAKMCEQLADKLRARAIDNAEATVMSAYELGFADGELDGVFCANALHVMTEPTQALAEFHRVLRPGGRLVLPTFCHGIDLRRRALSWLLGMVSPFVAYSKFTPTSLRAMVTRAGFDTREPILLPGRFPIAYLVGDRREP